MDVFESNECHRGLIGAALTFVDLSKLSPKQLLEIDACTRCGDCLRCCPVYSQRSEEGITPRGKIQAVKKFLRAQYGLWARLFGKKRLSDSELEKFSEMAYRCTLCGECAVQCPVSIDSRALWLSLKEMFVDLGHYPKNVGMMRKNILAKYNISGEPNRSRTDWLDALENVPAHRYQKQKAEVVYFVGCVAAYFPLAHKVPQSFVQILERTGVDFTLLGGEEWCCGFPLIGAGFRKEVEGFIQHHIEGVRERGARTVVFSCPSCYHTWQEEYHTDFKLFDSTQFLLSLLREGKLQFREEKIRVTYHDPCDLGRQSGIYEAPREILKSVPGVEFVELPTNREQSKCCGGGGLLEMVDSELSIAVAREKIKEIQSTGANLVISACQQCVRTIQSTARRMKVPLKVMYITEFILKQMK